MIQKIVAIALAGAAGTLARYGLGGLVQRLAGGWFPWGTFVVNATGCLLFGFVYALAEERLIISGQTRTIVLVGFLGAFTTFSTYMFETGAMLRDAQWLQAFGNVAGQNLVGVAFLFLGLFLGQLF